MLTLVHDKDIYRDGFDDGIEQGSFNTTITLIQNTIESLCISFDEVCDLLKIQDREQYRNHLNHN